LAMVRHEPGGVSIYPFPAREGDLVTVTYDGLLSHAGADQVYLYAGYDRDWKDTHFLRMQRTDRGWEKTFAVNHRFKTINFCFKDSANNWDNNNGQNWSIPVENPYY